MLIRKQNIHYVLKYDPIQNRNKIVSIDSNTGILQDDHELHKGLHQFLSIKHNVEIEPESLSTNYESNYAFFSRYTYTFGVTGTLGLPAHRSFLSETYKVITAVIPPSVHSRLTALPGFVTHTEGKADTASCWLCYMLESIDFYIRQERSVLVVVDDILEVRTLQYALEFAQEKPSFTLSELYLHWEQL